MNEGSKSSGSGAGIVLAIAILAAVGIFIYWGFGPYSYGEKATVWDYGHGEGAHRTATEEQINRFYEKVMQKPPNKRQGCQKYKKALMRYQYGYEYESDKVWNKKYKQIIADELKAWKRSHGKR